MMKLTYDAAQNALDAIMRIEKLIEDNSVTLDGPVMVALAINRNVLLPVVQVYQTQRLALQARVMGDTTPRDSDFVAKQNALAKAAMAFQNVQHEYAVKLFKLADLDLKKNPRLGAMLAQLACLFEGENELIAPAAADMGEDEPEQPAAVAATAGETIQ